MSREQVFCWRCVYLSVCTGFFAQHSWPAAALTHGGAETLRGFHSSTGLTEVELSTLFFFSFVKLLLCPHSLTHVVALSISVYLPQCIAPSFPLFLCSKSHNGVSGDLLCQSAKSPHPAQQLPSRCCFLP